MNPNTIPERPPLFRIPEPDPKYNDILYDHVQAGRSNEVLKLLNDNMVAVDAILDDNGNTALHLILGRDVEDHLEEQYVEVAKHLVTKRCHWNINNSDGKTALWLGISKGHVEVLLFLLEKNVREFLEEVAFVLENDNEKIRENAVYTISTIFERVEGISYSTGIEDIMQG